MDFDRYLEQVLARRRAGFENLVVLPRVDSTNLLGRRIAGECLEQEAHFGPAVILALEQTAGRGRRGRTWESPAGKGVYASLLLPCQERAGLETLPLLTAVGLCRSLNRILDSPPCRLKWPNDLLVGKRKIGGVLVESLRRGEGLTAVVIGFGINYGQRRSELPGPAATSLRLETAALPGLAEITWELLDGVRLELGHLGDAAYAVDGYQRLTLHRPGEHISCRTDGELVEGTFQGFDRRGFMRLERGGEEVLLAAGEVVSEGNPPDR